MLELAEAHGRGELADASSADVRDAIICFDATLDERYSATEALCVPLLALPAFPDLSRAPLVDREAALNRC